MRRSFNCGFNFKAGTPAPFSKISGFVFKIPKKASTLAFFSGFIWQIQPSPFPKSAASFSRSKKSQHSVLIFSVFLCVCGEGIRGLPFLPYKRNIRSSEALNRARAHTLVLSTLLQHFNQTPVRSEDLKTRYEEHLSICNSKIIPLFTCFHQMLFKKSKAFSKLFRQIGHFNRGGTY